MQQHLSEQATIDLHLHTAWSDGRWTAADLLAHVRERSFKLIAVTDHDRVDTIPQLQDLAKEQGVAVLNGVEISAAWRGQMADVLGYGFDPEQPELRRLVEQVHEGQRVNAEEVYAELLRRGYSFPERERLLAAQGNQLRVAGDCGLLLLKHGYVSSWREALAVIRDAGYREIKVDLDRRTVRRSGEEVRLSPTEFALLEQLVTQAGKVLTHRWLLQRVWGPEYGGEVEYLRVYLNRLRQKLEPDPAHPRYLLTEPGVGYRFVAPGPKVE